MIIEKRVRLFARCLIFQEDDVQSETDSLKKDRKSSIKKSDSIGDFDRGFNSIFEEDEQVPLFGQKVSNKLNEPEVKLSPEASAALAADKWRRKKARHVSFYGSVSDTGA
jgi:hypothetical protein